MTVIVLVSIQQYVRLTTTWTVVMIWPFIIDARRIVVYIQTVMGAIDWYRYCTWTVFGTRIIIRVGSWLSSKELTVRCDTSACARYRYGICMQIIIVAWIVSVRGEFRVGRLKICRAVVVGICRIRVRCRWKIPKMFRRWRQYIVGWAWWFCQKNKCFLFG